MNHIYLECSYRTATPFVDSTSVDSLFSMTMIDIHIGMLMESRPRSLIQRQSSYCSQ